MTGLALLDDPEEVEDWLRQEPYLHLYGLGDLDSRFQPQTVWYGWRRGGCLKAALLLYCGVDPPALLCLGQTDPEHMLLLLHQALPLLPDRLQCHLSPGLEDALAPSYRLAAAVPHLKMGLLGPSLPNGAPPASAQRLGPGDADDLLALYQVAYPDNAYDPSLLATRRFWGVRLDGRLVSAAGVHVYSARYRVAALGSIATHPGYRGRGLARAVTAALCRDLLPDVDHIGLNVRADNVAAIACYRALGFERTHDYVELEAWRYREAGGGPEGDS